MNRAYVVSARMKSLADLPQWAVCCDDIRQMYQRNEHMLLNVIPSRSTVANIRCMYCGKLKENMRIIGIVAGQFEPYTGIAAECVDLDEGIA